jgi:hypothetical protein
VKPAERLADVFDRGFREGVNALTPDEYELFQIQQFILEYEMGDLSGFFSNRSPDLASIHTTIRAMRRHGLSELATLVGEAAASFHGYAEPDPLTTWDEVIRHYDPNHRLEAVSEKIRALDDYGLARATFASS